MYEGAVIKEFVCRHTRQFYRPGMTYRSEDRGRLEQLADMGYVQFEPPAEPADQGTPAAGDEQPAKLARRKGKVMAKE